jgi:hypothetical protein
MAPETTNPGSGLPLIGDIIEGLKEGRVVPFLGAGVNCCGRPPGFRWKLGESHLPAGGELSLYLAEATRYPLKDEGERSKLLRVAQYMSTKLGPGPLRDALRRVLIRQYEPTPVHRFFASLTQRLQSKNFGHDVAGFQLLTVTTNYDDLLEQAFRDAGVVFDLLVYRIQGGRGLFAHVKPDGQTVQIDTPNQYGDLSLDVRPVIVKIHGAVDRNDRDRDSYVITEDDYIDYLAGADLSNFLPALVKDELIHSHFLFLGYSLQDWNLRVFLKRIWDEQQKYKYKSWAIQLDPDEIDRALWKSRDVEIVGASLDDYMAALAHEIEALPAAAPTHAA